MQFAIFSCIKKEMWKGTRSRTQTSWIPSLGQLTHAGHPSWQSFTSTKMVAGALWFGSHINPLCRDVWFRKRIDETVL